MLDSVDILTEPWFFLDYEYKQAKSTIARIIQDIEKATKAEEGKGRQSIHYLESLTQRRDRLQITLEAIQVIHNAEWDQLEDDSTTVRNSETDCVAITAKQLYDEAQKSLMTLKSNHDAHEESLESLSERRRRRLFARRIRYRVPDKQSIIFGRPDQANKEQRQIPTRPYTHKKAASTGTPNVSLFPEPASLLSYRRHKASSSLPQLEFAREGGMSRAKEHHTPCYRCGYLLPSCQLVRLRCAPDHRHCTSCLMYLFNQAMIDITNSKPTCLCGGEIAVGVVEGYIFWKTVYNYKKMYCKKEHDERAEISDLASRIEGDQIKA